MGIRPYPPAAAHAPAITARRKHPLRHTGADVDHRSRAQLARRSRAKETGPAREGPTEVSA